MHWVRKLLGVTASGVLNVCLFLAAISGALVFMFSSPDTPKSIIKDSGSYDRAVEAMIKSAAAKLSTSQTGQKNNLDIAIDQPEFVDAVESVLTPAFLQETTETIIDSTYDWLNGETVRPDFNIDVSEARKSLAQAITRVAAKRFNSLPACSSQQLTVIQAGNFDALKSPCKPPGVTESRVSSEIYKQLTEEAAIFPGNTLSLTAFAGEDGNIPLSGPEGKEIPENFQLAKRLPLLFGLVAAISAVIVVIAHRHRREGVRSIGFSMLGVGFFLIVNMLLITILFKQANNFEGLGELHSAIRDLVINVIDTFNWSFNKVLTFFAGGYVVLGIGLLIFQHFTPMKSDDEPADEHNSVDEQATNEHIRDEPAPSPGANAAKPSVTVEEKKDTATAPVLPKKKK